MENWEKYIYYFDAEHLTYYQSMLDGMKKIISFRDKEILCLGSGTGYYPLSYLDLGASHVTCLDISEDFLNVIRHKISTKYQQYKNKLELHMADMAEFHLNKKFDYIFCNGDSFSCLLSQGAQISCLENIKAHLKETASAYISTFLLSQRLNEGFKGTYAFKDVTGNDIKETVIAKFDYTAHRLDFLYEWIENDSVFTHIVPTRILTFSEMLLLFKVTGFRIKNTYGDKFEPRISDKNFEWIFEIEMMCDKLN